MRRSFPCNIMFPRLLILLSFVVSVSSFISRPLPILKPQLHPIRPTTELHGIPKLFRWLVDLYPLIVDSVKGNSNKLDVDNFYLDMNGIIHSCTHANSASLVLKTEKEMFVRIFSYTDRLYKLIRPKRVMFLAVDGVAPRAKMNQQRARRFRSSKEREVLINEHVAREGKLPDTPSFDSNCITPGTEFMYRLGIAFEKWIEHKMATDPFWQNGAEIVFSGPDVPGEGEHKVMDMIREDQQADPEYSLDRYRHCMYGLDADLIMLSLVTHEQQFILLREKSEMRLSGKDVMQYQPKDFEILEIASLRRMLQLHFRLSTEQAMALHEKREHLKFTGKTTSNAGNIPNNTAGDVEGKMTENAENIEAKIRDLVLNSSPSSLTDGTATDTVANIAITGTLDMTRVIDDFVFMCYFIGNDFLPNIPHLDIADGSLNIMINIYKNFYPRLGGYLVEKDKIHLPRLELFLQEIARREPLYFEQRAVDDAEPAYATDDYKDHYYHMKFGLAKGDIDGRAKIVSEYIHGLAWVARYYHNGCGSWTWFYPYLYAPLASDLVNLADIKIEFDEGRPFTPLLQLLSVLPPQSGPFLPKPYEDLMTNELSPLAPYYPRIFAVDANGKRNSWESVVQIPFLEEDVLISHVNLIDHKNTLTPVEKQRNLLGKIHRYDPKVIVPAAVAAATAANKGIASPVVEGRREAAVDPELVWGSALDQPQRFGGGNNNRGSSGGRGEYRGGYKGSSNSGGGGSGGYRGSSSSSSGGGGGAPKRSWSSSSPSSPSTPVAAAVTSSSTSKPSTSASTVSGAKKPSAPKKFKNTPILEDSTGRK